MSKNILIISPFYYPNIGGVETHLSDLTDILVKQKHHVYVLTYNPITTPNTSYLSTENKPYLDIRRFQWFGKNLFHTIEKYPLFDFIYLTPYLLIQSFVWMMKNHQKIDTIHSQGINGAFIGVILSKIFGKKHITSTHAIYEHISRLSQRLSTIIFNHTDTILCLSNKSKEQLLTWGVRSNKIYLYRYWINLKNFTPAKHAPTQFTVLYAGRLINKKGIPQLLTAATRLPKIKFIFAGIGPSQSLVEKYSHQFPNINYLGPISNQNMPNIYHLSSIFCLPSQYPEGYGRVVMESVASGLPVLGSNLGSIGEAVDSTVSILFSPTVKNIVSNINLLYKNKNTYYQLQKKCRPYALTHFGSKNFSLISRFY